MFVGIPAPEGDNANDKDLAAEKDVVDALKLKAKVVSVRRFAANANKTNATTNDSPYSPVVVEFENIEARNSVVSSAKNLSSTNHKNVFIRPDRTLVEQAFKRLLTERKEKNDILASNGTLNSPFRCVIRSDTVRCVNVSKTISIRCNDKHPFVDWEKVKSEKKKE